MLQPIINKEGHLNGFSWLTIILGYPILGIWYWCADQTHVQRVLAAKTLKDGQNGALFAGFLKITPVFLMGVLWKRGTKQGAMTTLYLGSLLGLAYFIIDMPSMGHYFVNAASLENYTGLISDPMLGLGIPFMMVGPILTVVCLGIYIVASLMSPAMDAVEVEKVCWDSPLSFLRGPITGASDPRMLTLFLIATVAILYITIQVLS